MTTNKIAISMDTLAEKTQFLLEYPQIMEKAASYAISEEAAAIIKESKPIYDTGRVIEAKNIVFAIHTLIKSFGDEPRSWLPSIGFLLPKIETQGTVLDLDEALAVGLFVERAGELRNWVIRDRSSNKELATRGMGELFALLGHSAAVSTAKGETFPECSQTASEIFKIIDREGNLRDIPVLRAIRKRISSLEKELKNAV
jgi:DNA mismatch repair protein MutS2